MPHDITVIHSISRKVAEKLSALHAISNIASDKTRRSQGLLQTFVYAKEKGSGIATNVRCEILSFSILAIYEGKDQEPCLDLNISQSKLRLDGVAACLTGELSSVIKLRFHHHISGMSLCRSYLSLVST